MMNSFIIKNADQSFEHYYHSMKKRKGILQGTTGTLASGHPKPEEQQGNFYGKIRGRRPAARDGHTGIMYAGTHLLIFGGDRHHMPFNDTFLLDLKAEVAAKSYLF